MTERKRKPKFWIDLIGFADYGYAVDVNLSLGSEFDLTGVVNTLHSSDTARVITLIFNRRKKKPGRRGFSLKQE